ncbi:MAG: PTS glucose transporter subunit IIA [Solobacterium sp.]|nr:PTS glucose transporter subunit IIA [Solobacterium sp.]MDD6121744.1 PTS glucose transporter subunit IIA [Solobacterium sp.]MDD6497851.1 PTS glucose transporter subunit IIA [Solobacterium sp.]MDD6835001.1 PTS glucose transporter subunit IIA [Solobacterium sp.]MDD6885175.1 PTS glucose transporter subunit IIA [Solobacterium sp.]
MSLLYKLFNKKEYSDSDIVALCSGKLIKTEDIPDEVFRSEQLGKTLGFEPDDGRIVSPVNGTVAFVYPTGHAFGITGNDGTGYLVHIGIDTVEMKGKGFKINRKQGEKVKAGETVVSCDLDEIASHNYKATTMLIITEPVRDYSFIDEGPVTRGQIISK